MDLLHGLVRLTQAAHFQDPPTGEVYRVPRPYAGQEPEPQPSPPTATLAEFSRLLRE